MSLELSERQRTTVAAAVTVLATVVIFCAIALLFWLLAIFLRTFSNVFLPLAVAAVVALVLGPYHRFWADRLAGGAFERFRIHRLCALFLVFLSLFLPVVGVGWYFGDILWDQVGELVEKAPVWWEKTVAWVESHWPEVRQFWEEYELTNRLREAVTGKEGAILSGLQALGGKAWSAGTGFFGAFGALLNWLLVPIYVAFILLGDLQGEQRAWSKAALPFLKSDTRDDIAYLGEEFVDILVAFFRGQFVIALLQGVLYAIGFGIVGLNFWLILGLMLGLLNIIPYLGSIVGLGVALPLALFQEGGGWVMVLGVMIVFTAVQMIEGYLLTPKIMGEQTGLHPMAIMVAIFFWGTALQGIMGMLLAIPLTAFFVVFWRLAREKYIHELV